MPKSNPTPARWSDFDPYLKAEHLQGKAFVLTIAGVQVVETHPKPGKSEMSPVLNFRETGKGLILSPTNRAALKKLFGDDIARSIGQRIAIKAEEVNVAGRETQPLRIYAAPPTTEGGQQPAQATPAPEAPTLSALTEEEEPF